MLWISEPGHNAPYVFGRVPQNARNALIEILAEAAESGGEWNSRPERTQLHSPGVHIHEKAPSANPPR